MKAKRSGLFCLLLIVVGISSQAQGIASAKQQIYACYAFDDKQNWTSALESMKRAVGNSTQTAELLELAEAQYAYVGYCLAQEKKKEADRYISKTQDLLKDILKKDSKSARANSLYGALLAMEIGRYPAKSVYLGPRSTSYIEKGRKYNSNEPVVWVEEGNFRYHAPSLFGGDKKKALESFEKAVRLFEARENRRQKNWMYLHALVWLAKSYEAEGQKQKALATYQKALAYEPDFSWVKNELLPNMKGKP